MTEPKDVPNKANKVAEFLVVPPVFASGVFFILSLTKGEFNELGVYQKNIYVASNSATIIACCVTHFRVLFIIQQVYFQQATYPLFLSFHRNPFVTTFLDGLHPPFFSSLDDR